MLANKADPEATGRVAELNSEGIIEIRFPYSRELVENVKRVPGRNWHSEEKMWDAPPSKDAIKFLEWHGFLLGAKLKKWIADKTPGPVAAELNIPGLRCTLRPYQAEGVRRIEAFKGRAILADSMGLGKTAQAIAWLQLHKTERPAVILCPAVGKEMWARKCMEWMDGKEKIVVLSGRSPDPAQFKGASILILNYDIVGNKTDKTKNKAGYVKIQEQSYTGWVDYLLDHGIKMIVADECHNLKNSKAQRGIAGLKMLKQIRYALPMSGTPIDNRPYEYWPILTNLAPHIFRNRYTYGKRYCGGTKTRFGWDFTGASNLAELHEVLEENIMIRRRKEDVLKELPPKVRAVVPIDVDLKAYRKAEAEIWADDEITLAKLTKLRQAAVAAKLKACGDWVEDFLETGEKLIVFAHHHFVMDHLRERFAGKYKIAEISGQTKGSRQEQEDLFQNDPACKLFLGSKSAKELITLTAASNVAFVEFFDTPGEMAQAEDRAHRIGQTGSVNVWFLIAAGTIEEDHAALLDAKLQVVTNVLDGKDVEGGDLIMELLNKIKRRK